MSYFTPSISLMEVVTSSPRDILKYAALKANISRQTTQQYYKFSIFRRESEYIDKNNPSDVVTKTIVNIEKFIRSIILSWIILSALSIYVLGATTGTYVAGGIAIGSAVAIRVLSKKIIDLKGEYAKVYSWGINHFRSVFSGFLQEFLP